MLQRTASPRAGIGHAAGGKPPAPSALWLTAAAALAFFCLYGSMRLANSTETAGGRQLLHAPSSSGSSLHAGSGGRSGGGDDLTAVTAHLAAWPADKPKACIVILARNR